MSQQRPPKPPPPVPKKAPLEDNPFLPPSAGKISVGKIDAGWLAMDDAEPAPPSAVEPAAPAPAPSLPPIQKRSRGKVIAIVLLPILLLAGGGVAYQQQQEAERLAKERAAAAQTAAPTVEAPVLTAEPPPPPTHAPDPPPPSASVEAKKPAVAAAPAASYELADRAYLDATPVPPGRKLIVDGRVVGTSPRKIQVHCGMHRVQIGDLDPENINFPCGGGEVTFSE